MTDEKRDTPTIKALELLLKSGRIAPEARPFAEQTLRSIQGAGSHRTEVSWDGIIDIGASSPSPTGAEPVGEGTGRTVVLLPVPIDGASAKAEKVQPAPPQEEVGQVPVATDKTETPDILAQVRRGHAKRAAFPDFGDLEFLMRDGDQAETKTTDAAAVPLREEDQGPNDRQSVPQPPPPRRDETKDAARHPQR